MGSANMGWSLPRICFMPLRIILRRMVNTVLTMRRKRTSSHPRANDCTLHFRRRIEHILVDGEEILHIIPSLNEHTQHAIGLAAWLGSHTLCHLLLDHACATWDQVTILHHLEEDLRGDVVGIIARQDKGRTIKHLTEVHLQEVTFNDIVAQFWEMLVQVGNGLEVDFHHLEWTVLTKNKLCKYAHARTYFQNGDVGASIHRVGDALRHAEVG